MIITSALIPGSQTPTIEPAIFPPDVKMAVTHIVFVLTAAGYLCALALRTKRASSSPGERRWLSPLPISLGALIAFSWFSLYWADLPARYMVPTVWNLVVVTAAFVMAACLIFSRPPEVVQGFLLRATLMVAGIGLIYCVGSVSNVGGLRQEESQRALATEFGIPRVQGPMTLACRGHIFVLPALAFALQLVAHKRATFMSLLPAMFCLMLWLLGMGSRSTMLSLGVFLAVMFLTQTSSLKKAFINLVLTLIIVAACLVVFVQLEADTTRLGNEDRERMECYETAFKLFENAPPQYQLFGQGYGAVWQSYILKWEAGGAETTGRTFTDTRYGRILCQPHSTFLLVIVELGIVGVVLFCCVALELARLVILHCWRGELPIFALAFAAAAPAVFTDTHLLDDAEMHSVMLLIFTFGLVALTRSGRRPLRAPRVNHYGLIGSHPQRMKVGAVGDGRASP
jgi:hypothetical protein